MNNRVWEIAIFVSIGFIVGKLVERAMLEFTLPETLTKTVKQGDITILPTTVAGPEIFNDDRELVAVEHIYEDGGEYESLLASRDQLMADVANMQAVLGALSNQTYDSSYTSNIALRALTDIPTVIAEAETAGYLLEPVGSFANPFIDGEALEDWVDAQFTNPSGIRYVASAEAWFNMVNINYANMPVAVRENGSYMEMLVSALVLTIVPSAIRQDGGTPGYKWGALLGDVFDATSHGTELGYYPLAVAQWSHLDEPPA